MRLLVTMLLVCLSLSACTTAEVSTARDNLRIGPVPLVRVEF
jgi:hypothetical protein